MLLLLLLVPLAACVPLPKTYILDIEDGTLKDVQLVGETPPELDLSGMQLKAVGKNALDNLSELKSLNLGNNSFKSLPEFAFSNLTSLEYLSLANNKLSSVKYLFVGLENLRTVNISFNPVIHLRRGHLFGLTKAAKILVDGNTLWSVSTGVFTNAFLKDEQIQKDVEEEPAQVPEDEANLAETSEQKEKDMDSMDRETQAAMKIQDSIEAPKQIRKDQKLKLCIAENTVTSLDILEKNEVVPVGCSKISINEKDRQVSLRGLGIKGFQEGWYRLEGLPIASLDLSNNEIAEITKETLNDLPPDLVYVNLLANRIREIHSQVIENENLRMLNLKDNLIEEIEEGALQRTNITGLVLTGNQLDDLTFVSSLPSTISELVITGNQISSLPDGVFVNLSRLVYLNLGNNKITRLQDNVFQGLDSLQVLILTRNSLRDIETDAFNGLTQLTTLYMYRNSLKELRKGTFARLESLKDLNLAWNRLRRIENGTFAEMPAVLDFLHLDYNEIEELAENSFVDVPRFTLSLNGNKISSIPRGAFNLANLRDLHLNNNTLTTIDGDSFEGLPQLKRLWLSENQIAEIRKGSCKNLGSLSILDISKNPFERLENGALYGLSTAKGNFLYIYNNQLKEIEAGLFEDV